MDYTTINISSVPRSKILHVGFKNQSVIAELGHTSCCSEIHIKHINTRCEHSVK
jgi:hypothetical protein